MGLYRPAGSPYWWYSFTVKGRRVRRSAQTEDRGLAETIAAKAKADALLDAITGRKPRMTLDAAFGRYYAEHASRLPSADDIYWHGREIIAALGAETCLSKLGDAAVSRAVATWRARLADGSVNRRLTTLRSVMRMAHDRWGVEANFPNWRAQWLREPAPRDRYLTVEEAHRLIDAAADHLKDPIRFSLLTGVRLTNCLTLDWSQIDLARREIRFRVKSRRQGGKPHVVPMSEPVLIMLANRPGERAGRVFRYEGRPITSFRRSWSTALRRAGITDFRWHDLRHTAASWMVQAGVPLDVVQSILGHEDISTTQRYAHRETSAKKTALDALASGFGHRDSADTPKPMKRKAES